MSDKSIATQYKFDCVFRHFVDEVTVLEGGDEGRLLLEAVDSDAGHTAWLGPDGSQRGELKPSAPIASSNISTLHSRQSGDALQPSS